MTKAEKISWLIQHAPGPYTRARAKAERELDDQTPIFCFCGALATGLHTSRCKKYRERIDALIINELKAMLPK